MSAWKDWLIGATAVGVLVFGLAVLHYNNGPSYEHHLAWADLKGMPAPSKVMFFVGCLITIVGSGAIGYLVGRRRGASGNSE